MSFQLSLRKNMESNPVAAVAVAAGGEELAEAEEKHL